jgi:glycosyltransferase involved in cell wall biosynthesis
MAICISRAVADELGQWFAGHASGAAVPRIRYVHLGADIAGRIGTAGMPAKASEVIAAMRTRPSFLMVGTVEPRKAHAAVLDAVEDLWLQGQDAMLVIVGRQGWMVEDFAARVRAHPENGKRLHWLDDASDETLEAAYAAATAMVLASRGEGFGLPIVEAAQRGLPVIARDLPVFREIAGTHAHYFGDDASLARTLREWLGLHARGEHPSPAGMEWLTWSQSAARLRAVLQELRYAAM